MPAPRKKFAFVRFVARWTFRFAAAILLVAIAATAYVFSGAVYRYLVVFPREARDWEAIRASRTSVELDDGWEEYRGICHSHSELSHDSEVPFPEILAAAKEADIRFICMSDHPQNGLADFSKGWKGEHDGVLFVRGFEMKYGFMPWGLPDDTILDAGAPPDELAARIDSLGGVLFFAHSEEEREWDLPQLAGMEIYNIHTDLKQRGSDGLMGLLPDILLSQGTYPDHVMRLIFTPQTAILKRWDDLNKTRPIAGIAGNDCHQNNGVRGYFTENNSLLLRKTSDDDIGEIPLNAVTKALLSMAFGPLTPGRMLFRKDLDPYVRSIRFVNTHVLVKGELNEASLLDALRRGRSFIAFDIMADARGFVFLADVQGEKAVMGEAKPFSAGTRLEAESPCEVRFTLLRDGEPVQEEVGRRLAFTPQTPGRYRVEASLRVNGIWVPWVYTNPIRLTDGTGADSVNGSVLVN